MLLEIDLPKSFVINMYRITMKILSAKFLREHSIFITKSSVIAKYLKEIFEIKDSLKGS